MPITANQAYFDAALRHQVGIRRYTAGQVKEILALLEKSDREVTAWLRKRLSGLGSPVDFRSQRLVRLLAEMRAMRAEGMRALRGTLTPNLRELAKVEAHFEVGLLERAVPIEFNFATVSATQLNAIVTSKPFQGSLLKDWYAGLKNSDAKRLKEAVQLGLTQGESIPNIVRRVAGTRAARYADGAMAITRRNAEGVVRTAVNHVSNHAREEVWHENEDIVSGLRWTSTLDGRTTPICQARDGEVAPIHPDKPIPEGEPPLEPPGARPPAHFRCRSVMVAILDGEGIMGNRPFVTDTRTRARREVDFRRQARQEGRPIKEVRREWADKNIGKVPAKTTYEEWLKKQPESFQDNVLGKTKAKMFRDGKVKLDQFVDRRGNELTLRQLEVLID